MVKNSPANVGDVKKIGFDPWIGTIPWRKKWQPTPVFLPEKSHGQKNLVGIVQGVTKDLDMIWSKQQEQNISKLYQTKNKLQ